MLRDDEGPNLTEEELEELLSISVDLGFETDATKVDGYLYPAIRDDDDGSL